MQRKLTSSMLYRLLGHAGLGVTMIVILSPSFMAVAYTDNESDFFSLCQGMLEMNYPVQIGIQPRQVRHIHGPLNQWIAVNDSTFDNVNDQLEFITMGHIEIGPFPADRPVSNQMFEKSYEIARFIASQPEIYSHAVIASTDTSHHILVPMVPVRVDSQDIAKQYKYFWRGLLIRAFHLLDKRLGTTTSFHLSDTMPVIGGHYGIRSGKEGLFSGLELEKDRSYELHKMIMNTSISRVQSTNKALNEKPAKRKCRKKDNGQMVFWPTT